MPFASHDLYMRAFSTASGLLQHKGIQQKAVDNTVKKEYLWVLLRIAPSPW
jgi:hypothetical protein